MTVRYGARQAEHQRNREVEATSAAIWSTAVTAVWENDLDVIRAVLPPPLERRSRSRASARDVNMGTGIPIFGAGWFGVRARHGSREGEYALFMPMTTEQATVGGRETYGEPKKIGAVTIDVEGRPGARAHGAHGLPARRCAPARSGRRSTSRRANKTDFYFKLSPSPDGKGFDTEPALVHVHRHEEARDGRTIDGALELHESPLDPIADIPVGRLVSLQFAQVTTTQHGEVVERVPRGLAPAVRAPALRRPLGARKEGRMSEARDAVSDRYVIISADAHAGLPCEEYRPYLDARYTEEFGRVPRRAQRGARRSDEAQLRLHHPVGDHP